MANNFISGIKSKFLYVANSFDVEDMDWDSKVDTDDITHTGANGYQVLLPGIMRANVKITFVYDTLNKPTISPQNFQPGTFAVLSLQPDGNDTFTALQFLITNFTWKGGPKAGAVRCTATAESIGQYTMPSA